MIDDFSRPPVRSRTTIDNFHHRTAPEQVFRPPSIESEHTEAEQEPDFRTPEQVAEEHRGHFLPPLETVDMLPEHAQKTPQPGRLSALWDAVRHPTRKHAITGTAVVVVLAVGGGVAYGLTHKAPPPPKKPVVVAAVPTPTPKPILSPLTGMPVTADQAKQPVTGVMIENSSGARPQSGLDQAGVVYEAIAEAGITRFLALYQETNPAVLGPVRSSRPYYLQWALAFDAGYAHVGGSPEALQDIKDLGVRDLDQFFNAGAYHRISSRYAPHNMYTSIDALHQLEQAKGYTSSTFTPFVRAAKEAPSKTPTARSIDFDISGAYYNVHYDYDAATNSYKRSEGGSPHIDNETKKQLSPKVVIALAMPYSLEADGYHSMYNTQGSGQMLLFQNGTVTPGTWSKGDAKSQFVFKDDAGADMQLNPGQTWITVLSDISKASYKP